jgi:Domain of unknown function (DUF4124)
MRIMYSKLFGDGHRSMKKILFSLVIAGLMTSSVVYADKIYSWVDEKGVTHYGENPPKDTPARQLNARTGHSDPVEYGSGQKAEPEKAKAATGPQPSEERCETARKNLQVLTTNPRVKTTDKNGENRYMTQEEMQVQVETMEKIIAEECSGK